MNLLELTFKVDSNLVEALDLYMRRIGACGVSFEDPNDAINIIEAQENGEEDASIFFDPAFIDDLTDLAEVKVWFKREITEDKLTNSEINDEDNAASRYYELKKALPSTSAVYIYKEAKDLIDVGSGTDSDYSEKPEDGAIKDFKTNDNPYYVDREVDIEDINSEIRLDRFFPKAGGNEYCNELHSFEEFFDIFSEHLRDFFAFFFMEEVSDWECREIEEKDWLEAYKKHYGVVRISDKIIICPSWENYKKQTGEIIINLDPESAFGTGMHASTAMCARFIEEYADKYSKLLCDGEINIFDVGTGSGILAIIADKILTEESAVFKIEACDIDSNAVRVAKDNCIKNQCEEINTFVGSIDSVEETFDLIIANLITDLQLRFASEYVKILKRDAVLIVSGIIEERGEAVVDKFTQNGLEILKKTTQNGWLALMCKKK